MPLNVHTHTRIKGWPWCCLASQLHHQSSTPSYQRVYFPSHKPINDEYLPIQAILILTLRVFVDIVILLIDIAFVQRLQSFSLTVMKLLCCSYIIKNASVSHTVALGDYPDAVYCDLIPTYRLPVQACSQRVWNMSRTRCFYMRLSFRRPFISLYFQSYAKNLPANLHEICGKAAEWFWEESR